MIIVSWNTCGLLRQCLESLERSDAGGDPVEVIVVDNASADGSAEMVRTSFPAVRLIENDANRGFAAANNAGIAVGRGRYVLLLNSDTEVLPGAPAALVDFMEARPRAGACGPLLLNPDGSLQPSCHPMLTPGREFWRLMFLERIARKATYAMERWDRSAPRRVEVIKGACLMLRRAALDEAGLLDESYFMYTEEVDLCHRLARAGWELWWAPGAGVIHYGGASSRQAREDMYVELYRSKARFYRKFGGEPRAQQFKRYLKLAYAPRCAAMSAAALLAPRLRRRSALYRRFMAEIEGM